MGFGRYRFRRSFGQVNSQFRGARPSTYPNFQGLLDLYPGAAAAYSLRALSSGWLAGDVVEVRRSSDSTSDAFTAGQITSGAMVDWVNEEVDVYTSNFTTNDGWAALNGTLSSNESVGGESPVAKFMVDTSSAVRRIQKTYLTTGVKYRITGELYIPASNDVLSTITVQDTGLGINVTLPAPTVDTWTSFSMEGTVAGTTLLLRAAGVADAGGDDYFSVRNIVTTVILSDGFVSTWYDQSGFANDATQITTTAQPKIVDAGSLVTGGLDFDGVDDVFGLTTTLTAQPYSTFAAYQTDKLASYLYGDAGALPVAGNRSTGSYVLHHGAALDGGAHSSIEIVAAYIANSTSSSIHVNGVSKASGDAGNTSNLISMVGKAGSSFFEGTINELIIYNSDQSANRADIETNINDAYSIF